MIGPMPPLVVLPLFLFCVDLYNVLDVVNGPRCIYSVLYFNLFSPFVLYEYCRLAGYYGHCVSSVVSTIFKY